MALEPTGSVLECRERVEVTEKVTSSLSDYLPTCMLCHIGVLSPRKKKRGVRKMKERG